MLLDCFTISGTGWFGVETEAGCVRDNGGAERGPEVGRMTVAGALPRVAALLALLLPAQSETTDPFDESPYLKMYQLLPRAYRMLPEQEEQFQALMGRVVEQYHEYLSGRADEVNQLRRAYAGLMAVKRSGGDVTREQLQELRRRCSAIIQASPLGIRNVTFEIEKFLPSEQVLAARGLKPTAPATTKAAPAEQEQPPAVVQPERGPARSRLSFKPPEAWPGYVEGFIARYQLGGESATRARELLQELQREAQQYRRVHRDEYQSAARIADVQARRDWLDQLEGPIGQLFDQLRTGLKNLAARRAPREAGQSKR
jgi:hypothetical protein